MNMRFKNFLEELYQDKLLKALIKDSSIALSLRVVGVILGYLFIVLVTRNFGAKIWGCFALSLVLLQISTVLGKVGLDIILMKFASVSRVRGDFYILWTVYKKSFLIILITALSIVIPVYYFSSVIASSIFNKPYLDKFFKLVALIIIPYILLSFHSEGIRGLKKIKEYMFLQQTGVFGIASLLLFLLTYLFLSDREIIPLISYGISVWILMFFSVFLWFRYLSIEFTCCSISNGYSEIGYLNLLLESVPMMFANSLALIMGWVDILMLGMLSTNVEVGIYSVVLRLVMVLNFLFLAVDSVVSPDYAARYNVGDIEGLQRIVNRSVKLVLIATLPVSLFLMLFSKNLLSLFGREFLTGYLALIILTLGRLVRFFLGPSASILSMTGNQGIYSFLLLLAILLNIILNYILIPKFSINGAALSTAISIAFLSLCSNFVVRKKVGIKSSLL